MRERRRTLFIPRIGSVEDTNFSSVAWKRHNRAGPRDISSEHLQDCLVTLNLSTHNPNRSEGYIYGAAEVLPCVPPESNGSVLIAMPCKYSTFFQLSGSRRLAVLCRFVLFLSLVENTLCMRVVLETWDTASRRFEGLYQYLSLSSPCVVCKATIRAHKHRPTRLP